MHKAGSVAVRALVRTARTLSPTGLAPEILDALVELDRGPRQSAGGKLMRLRSIERMTHNVANELLANIAR